MKRFLTACALVVAAVVSAEGLSNINTTSTVTVNNDGNHIIYAEIADNGDSVIFLKKDSGSTQSDDWSFYLYGLAAGDTKGVIKVADPSVFYGFSPGPDVSVLYTHQPVDGIRSIYYATFSGDSAQLVGNAVYPAYVSSNQIYNFAYVKDSNVIYVAGMQADTAQLSAPAVAVIDIEDTAGAVRFLRWSPDAQSLVFALEASTESTASIYVLSDVQKLAKKDTTLMTIGDSSVVRVTTDTYYNTNPHFVGGDNFILYNRAIPYRQFKFSSFSDTGGCTSIILTRANWDAVLVERATGLIYNVDSTTTASTVGSAAHPRGYALLVSDAGDTDGDVSFTALVSGLNVTSLSSGTFYFAANASLTLQAGATPTATFFVVPDTPKSPLRTDTVLGNASAVIAPVLVSASVPGDSMDKQKIQVTVTYLDIEVAGYIELSAFGLAHDTSTPNAWRGAGSGLNTNLNSVTITPPHFSPFAVGISKTFDVAIEGQSCLIRRATSRPWIVDGLRRLRDLALRTRAGRALVRRYYED